MEIIDDKKWSEVSAKIKQNKSKSKKAELDSSPMAQSDTTATPVILREPATEESIDTYKLEAEHQAATAMVEANMAEFHAERQEIREKEQQEREALIAEASRLTGRVEAFNFTSQVATVATLINLQKIKESGIYKELPNCKTWEDYCNSIGFSRRKIDEDLQNLNTFGENFLATGRQLGLGYRQFRS